MPRCWDKAEGGRAFYSWCSRAASTTDTQLTGLREHPALITLEMFASYLGQGCGVFPRGTWMIPPCWKQGHLRIEDFHLSIRLICCTVRQPLTIPALCGSPHAQYWATLTSREQTTVQESSRGNASLVWAETLLRKVSRCHRSNATQILWGTTSEGHVRSFPRKVEVLEFVSLLADFSPRAIQTRAGPQWSNAPPTMHHSPAHTSRSRLIHSIVFAHWLWRVAGHDMTPLGHEDHNYT